MSGKQRLSAGLAALLVVATLLGIGVFVCRVGAQAASPAPLALAPATQSGTDEERIARLDERLTRLESGNYFIPRNDFERRINDLDKRLKDVEDGTVHSGVSQPTPLERQLALVEQRLKKLEDAAAKRTPTPASVVGQQSSLEGRLQKVELRSASFSATSRTWLAK
ncbi:MAG: hypothetical protein NTW86_01300 [Candidatus Sumerlaeota bacterium]|nr:hypothetical protein [Candidatus Sumerlaeota bacterium]